MTALELLVSLGDEVQVFRNGAALWVETSRRLTPAETAALRAHKAYLLRVLPKAPDGALPPEEGNVMESWMDEPPGGWTL